MQAQSKFSEAVVNKACSFIEDGIAPNKAFLLCGVKPGTFRSWRLAGERGIQPYVSMVEKLQIAITKCELTLLQKVQAKTEEDVKASTWLLERLFKRYNPKTTTTVVNKNVAELSNEKLVLETLELLSHDCGADLVAIYKEAKAEKESNLGREDTSIPDE